MLDKKIILYQQNFRIKHNFLDTLLCTRSCCELGSAKWILLLANYLPKTDCKVPFLALCAKLAQSWHKIGMALCQVCGKHFLVDEIPSCIRDSVQTCLVSVPSLC